MSGFIDDALRGGRDLFTFKTGIPGGPVYELREPSKSRLSRAVNIIKYEKNSLNHVVLYVVRYYRKL